MPLTPTTIAAAITAIGALGTAAFGIVDTTKLIYGGVSSSGFIFIASLLKTLAPDDKGVPHDSAITGSAILETIRANWLNGVPESDLKSSLKTLVKLRLNETTAAHLAAVTGVAASVAPAPVAPAITPIPGDDPGLVAVARALNTGQPLTPQQMNVYGRFDVLLATMIDRAYQRADQRYRNTAKFVAAGVAILLAEIAAFALRGSIPQHTESLYIQAFVAGLLATPLAPIAKDLATSISTAAKAVQSVQSLS